MRKFAQLLFFNICIILTLHAQDTVNNDNRRFSLEFIAEPGLSLLKESDFVQYISANNLLIFGGNYGIGINYYFRNSMGFELSILYSFQGEKSNSYQYLPSEVRFWKNNSKLQYLKIPVNYEIFILNNNNFSLILSTGMYFGLLTSYKNNENYSYLGNDGRFTIGNSVTSNYSTISNITAHNELMDTTYIFITKYQGELIRPFDFGCQFKAGFLFSVSNKIQIPILLSYEMGLFNILNNDSWYHVNLGNSSNIWRIFTWGDQKKYTLLISIHLGLIYKI